MKLFLALVAVVVAVALWALFPGRAMIQAKLGHKSSPIVMRREKGGHYNEPFEHNLKGKYVVVDLSSFTLYRMQDGLAVGRLPVSTGTGRYFDEFDRFGVEHTGWAVTPIGTFYADHGTPGMYHAPLGYMGWPVWLTTTPEGEDPQGVAIHGENIAAHQNLSHGCIRVDWDAAPDFYHWIPQDAVVIVQQ